MLFGFIYMRLLRFLRSHNLKIRDCWNAMELFVVFQHLKDIRWSIAIFISLCKHWLTLTILIQLRSLDTLWEPRFCIIVVINSLTPNWGVEIVRLNSVTEESVMTSRPISNWHIWETENSCEIHETSLVFIVSFVSFVSLVSLVYSVFLRKFLGAFVVFDSIWLLLVRFFEKQSACQPSFEHWDHWSSKSLLYRYRKITERLLKNTSKVSLFAVVNKPLNWFKR